MCLIPIFCQANVIISSLPGVGIICRETVYSAALSLLHSAVLCHWSVPTGGSLGELLGAGPGRGMESAHFDMLFSMAEQKIDELGGGNQEASKGIQEGPKVLSGRGNGGNELARRALANMASSKRLPPKARHP